MGLRSFGQQLVKGAINLHFFAQHSIFINESLWQLCCIRSIISPPEQKNSRDTKQSLQIISEYVKYPSKLSFAVYTGSKRLKSRSYFSCCFCSIKTRYLYKYDKVGKTGTLRMYPRSATMALGRVATLVCPVRST